MKRTVCQSTRPFLGSYVDGELTGAQRLRVSRHLEACAACAGEVAAMSGLGDLLREAVDREALPRGMEGLASGVVARVRAESAVSIGARFERAVGDSRLLWVGVGSLSGAAVTMFVVAVALFFGQTPALAGAASTLGNAGTLMAVAQSQDGRGGILVHFDSAEGTRIITESMLAGPSGEQLVDALAGLVTRKGRVVELSEMAPADRARTEELLDELMRRQTKELVQVELQQVRLVASTDVSAKGL